MRVIVFGGTRFVGRAISEWLVGAGHEVLAVHRGSSNADLAGVRHLYAERAAFPGLRAELTAFEPDAAVDVSAGNGADAEAALAALPENIRLVAISSGDVYRAYAGLNTGRTTDGVPLTEEAPLRVELHFDGPDRENIEIERLHLPRGGTALRLGAVYGPHDYQHRFEFVLRRVRAGRERMPIGPGMFLFSRVAALDVGRAVELALTEEAARGEAFNIVEPKTAPYLLLAHQVRDAAGADLELVPVPAESLPEDLSLTGTVSQHLLMDPTKARTVLGWEPTDPDRTLRTAVRWYLDHPPTDVSDDFTADEQALTTA